MNSATEHLTGPAAKQIVLSCTIKHNASERHFHLAVSKAFGLPADGFPSVVSQVQPVLQRLKTTLTGSGAALLMSSVLLFGLIRAGSDADGMYGEFRVGGRGHPDSPDAGCPSCCAAAALASCWS